MVLIENLRMFIIAGSFLSLRLAEVFFPYRSRANTLQHDAQNLSLLALNILITIVVFSTLFVKTDAYITAHQFGLLFQFKLNILQHVGLAIVLIDGWQYWWHRMNHRLKFLWRFHKVHHVDNLMCTSTAFRFHLGEIFISNCLRLVLMMILGLPLICFMAYEALSLPVVIWQHSNLRLPLWLDQIILTVLVTPNMHWRHHSQKPAETDSNYSSFLSLWDSLFNSYSGAGNRDDIKLGLKQYPLQAWSKLKQTLLLPWR